MRELEIECLDARWGFAFLSTDSRLSCEEREGLIVEAIEMHLETEEERKVSGERYEGIIHTEGKYRTFGGFGGQEFKAELDTDFGKTKLSFLVTEYINPALN